MCQEYSDSLLLGTVFDLSLDRLGTEEIDHLQRTTHRLICAVSVGSGGYLIP